MTTYTHQVTILVGIPGSGKSTWAKEIVELELEPYGITSAIISRDDVRFSMLNEGEDYFKHEKEVFEEFIRQINESIAIGINYVFIDATHINEASRKKVLKRLVVDPKTRLDIVDVQCDVNIALERNRQREGLRRVPDAAILNMEKRKTSPIDDHYPDDRYGFSNIGYTVVYSDLDLTALDLEEGE